MRPGVEVQKMVNMVKREVLLLIKAPGGAPTSLSLSELTGGRLQQKVQ